MIDFVTFVIIWLSLGALAAFLVFLFDYFYLGEVTTIDVQGYFLTTLGGAFSLFVVCFIGLIILHRPILATTDKVLLKRKK